jgi:hypothetical protein
VIPFRIFSEELLYVKYYLEKLRGFYQTISKASYCLGLQMIEAFEARVTLMN